VDRRLLSLDHIHVRGSDLFRAACELDLEGIAGKWVHGTYWTDGRATSWLKVKKSRLYADPRPSRAVQHSARSPPALSSARPDPSLSIGPVQARRLPTDDA
jgi:hypothetical protein